MASKKTYRSELKFEITEENIAKIKTSQISSGRYKFSKHSVAPSDYQVAYDKNVYPRTVFKSENIEKPLQPFNAGIVVERAEKIEQSTANALHVPCVEVNLTKDYDHKLQQANVHHAEVINDKNIYCFTGKNGEDSVFRNSIKNKLFKYGEKGSGFTSKTGIQDFYELRNDCLARGVLFEDSEFPPADSSLFFSHRPDRHFEWKRPGVNLNLFRIYSITTNRLQEIVDNPQLFVEGFSRFDVQQGELGDCWLLAAVANLTLYRRLFFQIVPDDQSFDENYAGIFHFRFWQYGRWIDVVIDDRLPTYRGELVFLHSTEENEFWSALLEKAYAKLHGSYEALKGGSTCEAMEDFTGGVTEMYEMKASPPNLFKIIVKAYERWSLMGCSIEPDPDVLEAQTPEGLIRGHAYSITKVQYVNIATPNVSGKIPLLRLRNPWGNESEWNGAWSDNSPEWQYISEDQKEELGLNFDADGEFWMSFKDFQSHFDRLEICNLNPDSLAEDELTEGRNKKWEMSVFEGEWVRGVTAGGCRNFLGK
jgi:calpain